MSAHAYLPPSGAGVWVKCAAAPYMWALYPEQGDGVEAAEGTAAHWVFEQMFALCPVDVGYTAPNGVIVTQEMIEGAEMYVDTVREKAGEGAELHIEERVAIPYVHELNWGTPDTWAFTHRPTTGRATLHLSDYKFGHGYVEVFENWQLLDYVSGIRDQLGIDGHAEQHVDVEMTIVQPRSYHSDGPVRTWRRPMADLRQYFNILQSSAANALSPQPVATPGPHCKHCSGRHACNALQAAAYHAADFSRRSIPIELPPAALGLELAMLSSAKELLDARVSGLEESVFAAVRGGAQVPHYGAEPTFGRTTWNRPHAEIVSLGDMMGKNLVKPGLVTPKQAIKLGIDAALVDAYSFAPPGGLKLVPVNANTARKVFQK